MQEPSSFKRRFDQYILPGIIFQSVLIGGAYATGREIVEYGAKFGALGIWSVAAILAGFSLMSALTYEFARLYRVYDYRRFVKSLIGGFWPLFDALFMVMVMVVIAVVSAASGGVVKEVFGWPYWLGIGLVISLVGLLNFWGRHAIERFKTMGTVLLYAGYLIFTGVVLAKSWGRVGESFANHDTTFVSTGSFSAAVMAGVLYVGYNLSAMPATLFVLDRQTERRQALWSGLITGILATVPFGLTFLAVMCFYPDGDVLGAPVPWLVMLKQVAGSGVISLYALVVLWTLVETSTGLIHAITDRISVNLKESGRRELSPMQVVVFTVLLLVGSAVLSRVGLIALVAQGYGAMAYGFLALFALPLLTIGVFRIVNRRTA